MNPIVRVLLLLLHFNFAKNILFQKLIYLPKVFGYNHEIPHHRYVYNILGTQKYITHPGMISGHLHARHHV
jgi:hypothetical protein